EKCRARHGCSAAKPCPCSRKIYGSWETDFQTSGASHPSDCCRRNHTRIRNQAAAWPKNRKMCIRPAPPASTPRDPGAERRHLQGDDPENLQTDKPIRASNPSCRFRPASISAESRSYKCPARWAAETAGSPRRGWLPCPRYAPENKRRECFSE